MEKYTNENKWKSYLVRLCAGVLVLVSIGLFNVHGQQKARLEITSPARDNSIVTDTPAYFRGFADPSGTLFLNGIEVPVYSTGVFAAPLPLQEGTNELQVWHVMGADTLRRPIVVVFEKPAPPHPTAGFAIEHARILPGGDLWLQPGDLLQVEMKATPGMEATFYNGTPLFEVDTAETGVAGIYRGEYILQSSDHLTSAPVSFSLHDKTSGKTVAVKSDQRLTVLNQSHVLTGRTTGEAPLYYGLGSDRLGGAKMGYLDSLVKLEVTGRMNDMYRVRLSGQAQAYIPLNSVRLQEGVNFRPYSLTGSWSVTTDSVYDFVRIGLAERLPYTHVVRQHPTRIVVDIYGAVSNSNWMTQKEGLVAIENVWYEQVSKDVFRVFIELKEEQLWGYQVGYEDNRLVVRVKPQPDTLDLRGLTVAVDAGHGGSNSGAAGMTGVVEKDLNLAMALKLKAALEAAGSNVLMTRTRDQSVRNSYRLQRFRQSEADLLISIHCNSSRNPLVQGVSTYYRHHAYRPLSTHILSEMRKLGLADFGNVGGFNFTLNAPTELPTVLVEVGFLSNPADEERLLDPAFHDEVAGRIVEGVRGFFKGVGGG
ncbi:N-acetylmuramoyl-L-alanine amidase [Parapedobacter sp. 10938]|uniref:N-acetylmuramoyl-L-alanine amidase n=1 Tax=Parapedobacter flavus TaxID=3110225 RepID=UPI002DB8D916|nr:N-acetylmuramoyl-L-alanine amidase [Parapedobacter sp. 10938]MEC3880042.1 N-acetylmuramoyl-L-alanine amidase [Parapedobacter sp. 10938]